MDLALETLKSDFLSPDSEGPLLASDFRFGGTGNSVMKETLREDLVMVAEAMMEA